MGGNVATRYGTSSILHVLVDPRGYTYTYTYCRATTPGQQQAARAGGGVAWMTNAL